MTAAGEGTGRAAASAGRGTDADGAGRAVGDPPHPGQRALDRRAFLRASAGAAVGVAAAATAAGTAAAQDAPYGGWFEDVDNYDGTVDRRGRSEVTVEVGAQGNGGPFAFEPAAVRIDPGTTVTFEWTSDNHNAVVETQPEGAGWEGHDPIQNTGFSFTSTFETEGAYTYFCRPHRPLGMKGAVVVGDEPVGEGPVGPPPGEGGGGGEDGAGGEGGGENGGGEGAPAFTMPSTPVLVGSGLLLAALAPALLGAAWLLRDRGRQVGPDERGGPGAAGEGAAAGGAGAAATAAEAGPVETESTALAAVERELDHESFDPTGTLVLVVVYGLILVVMWVFMYFVEFLGNGPTVVG